MSKSTTYNVDLNYNLKGNARQGLKGLHTQAQKTTSGFSGLKQAMGMALGAGLVAGGYKALIGYNNEINRIKIGLSTVMAMNTKMTFKEAQVGAERLHKQFTKMAITSPATTADFADMANQISSSVFQAGLGVQGLEKLTKGAVTASLALGAPAEMMALDVTQMLNGVVQVKDRFARQLLASVGEKDHLKFNKYSADKRASIVGKTFDSEAIRSAAEAYGNSFEGVTSTLKDNIQMALGKVGLPLMKAIGKEVQSWNDWMAANPEKMKEIMDGMSNALVKGFSFVKDVVKLLVNNASTLLTIGKIWLAVKIGGAIGNQLGKLGGAGAGAAGWFGADGAGRQAVGWTGRAAQEVSGPMRLGEKRQEAGGRLGALGALPMLGQAAAAGYAVGTAFNNATGASSKLAEILDSGLIPGFRTMSTKLNIMQKNLDAYDRTMAAARKGAAAQGGMLGADTELTRQAGDRDHREAQKKVLEDLIANTKAGRTSGDKASELMIGNSGYMQRQANLRSMGTQLGLTDTGGFGAGQGGGMGTLAQMEKALAHVTSKLDTKNTQLKQVDDGSADKAMATAFTMFPKTLIEQLGQQELTAKAAIATAEAISKGLPITPQSIVDAWTKYADETNGTTNLKGPKPRSTNVNINKIEVASNDPDRFVHGMFDALDEVSSNPSGARDTLRGGF